MKENFDISLPKTLIFEGGFSNHPADRGGPTNLGITLKTLCDFDAQYDGLDLDEDGDVDIDDLRMLDIESAAVIYKKYYWDKMRCDELPSGVDFLTFDFAVNSGQRNSTRILQKAINRLSKKDIVVGVDGILGNNTLQWANNVNPSLLVDAMLKERAIFYDKLIAQNPSQSVFRKGWFNRLESTSQEVQEFM